MRACRGCAAAEGGTAPRVGDARCRKVAAQAQPPAAACGVAAWHRLLRSGAYGHEGDAAPLGPCAQVHTGRRARSTAPVPLFDCEVHCTAMHPGTVAAAPSRPCCWARQHAHTCKHSLITNPDRSHMSQAGSQATEGMCAIRREAAGARQPPRESACSLPNKSACAPRFGLWKIRF